MEHYLDDLRPRVRPRTWGQSRLCLRRFSRFLGEKRLSLSQLQPDHFDLFARHLAANFTNRHGQPISRARIQRHLHELRPFLRYLYRTQRLLLDHSVHLSQVSIPKSPPRFVPTYRQMLQLMALPDLEKPRQMGDRAMFEVAYGCGLRVSEVLRLSLKDLDFEAGVLVVRRGKGGYTRQVPLGRHASHYLQLYIREARPRLTRQLYPELWISKLGRPFVQASSLWPRLAAYQERLDFPVTWHGLRHAFATHLLEGGASLRAVQLLLGHVHLNTTETYTRVRSAALKRVHQGSHPRG